MLKRHRTAIKAAISWIMLSALLLLLSLWSVMASINRQAQQELALQIPQRLDEALRYSLSDDEVIHTITRLVNDDLQPVNVESRIPVIRQCRIGLLDIGDSTPASQQTNTLTARYFTIEWLQNSSPQNASFSLRCQPEILPLVLINGGAALFAILAIFSLPLPLSSTERAYLAEMHQLGLKHQQARRMIQRISPMADTQQRRLELGISRIKDRLMPTTALDDLLDAPTGIVFDHDTHSVTAHGITVILSKTPYFYYALYAQRRKQGRDGWILNPANDRPDSDTATELLTLMTSHNGHQKAINDLRDHGLRAKILDQNRNKIKDELCNTFGDGLAADLLFETKRDERTGRHLYRLKSPASEISIKS